MDDTSQPSQRTSIYVVAPLRIEKGKRSTSITSRGSGSQKSRPRSRNHSHNRSAGGHSHSSSNQQITPPPSPHPPYGSYTDPEMSPEFHPFLRAFYPFHPTYSSNSTTVTLPLNAGDVILVHSVHTNGWADGTMLSSGARGWLPTNYCESYEAIHIRALLKGCLELFEQFRAGSVNQIAVTGILAGVRHLLESTECLTREADIVRSNDAIRKARKVVLNELSGLVKTAKKINSKCGDDVVDELILRSFKIVVRGVRFLDVWYDQYEITESCAGDFDEDDYLNDNSVPPTPPCDSLASRSSSTAGSDANAGGYFSPQSADRDQIRYTPTRRVASVKTESHPLPSTPYTPAPRANADEHLRPQSIELASPQQVYALARLNTTHDVLLSYLGSYIGRIHLQARFTPQLQLTQQQSVAAARDLLAVVEAVYARDPRAGALETAKEALYQRISSLISATREVVSNRTEEDMGEDEDGILIPDGGRSLVEAATGCVRGAGECVAKSKFAIERIGDFVLEPAALNIGLGITTDPVEAEDALVPACETQQEEVAADAPTQEEIDRDLMPPPPTPDKIPPPLPPKDSPAPPQKDSPPLLPLKDSPPLLPRKDTSLLPPKEITPLSLASTTPALTVDTSVRSSITSSSTVAPSSPVAAVQQPTASRRSSTASSLSPPMLNVSPSNIQGEYCVETIRKSFNKSVRADSIGAESLAATDSTGVNSVRGSEFSIVSQTSTRATTPEPLSSTSIDTPILSTELALLGSSQVSLASGSGSEYLSESHAEDLTFNKDGQITGGTLPALVERMTVHNSTPDAVFVATFYLTFRLFTTPRDFAEALVDRFDTVGSAPGATPVRLRVYNVFKGWLESHWRNSVDGDALEIIISFAGMRLKEVLPGAAKRLLELAEKAASVDGPLVPRLVSGMGKTTSSSTTYSVPETPILTPVITRSQLNALKGALGPNGVPVSILDFDPLELARQLTLKESRMFCSILPEELIAQEWTKKSGSLAQNVLAMSSLSTDLAHLVAETILDVPDTKKRAVVIKHWIKIADRCLELNNYDSLMAIMCTLNASTILRLKKTWELVSFKTKQVLEHLRSVIDVSKNHAVLRARLRSHVPPCLPFLGTYLTDLTFVDVGNPSKRPLSIDGSTKQLINFDKHIKTARIISELQRFQIPYRIQEIPEMQSWIDQQIDRVHNSKAADVQHLYRRSLLLEPRETQTQRPTNTPEVQTPPPPPPQVIPKEHSAKSDLFAWAHVFRAPVN